MAALISGFAVENPVVAARNLRRDRPGLVMKGGSVPVAREVWLCIFPVGALIFGMDLFARCVRDPDSDLIPEVVEEAYV